MLPYSVLLNNTHNSVVGGVLVGIFIGCIFGCPILIGLAAYFYDTFVDWWDRFFGFNYGNSGGYVPPTTTPTTKVAKPKATVWGKTTDKWGLYPEDRKEPPKATFFGRLDGEEVSDEGPWEEIYLNTRELGAWNRKKLQKEVVSTQDNTKTDIMDESKVFQEQYEYNAGYRD